MSTREALERLRTDAEPFDLTSRLGTRRRRSRAGLRLLGELRAAQHASPMVFHHGETNAAQRRQRTGAARAAGALGEAVYPHELMNLVARALAG